MPIQGAERLPRPGSNRPVLLLGTPASPDLWQERKNSSPSVALQLLRASHSWASSQMATQYLCGGFKKSRENVCYEKSMHGSQNVLQSILILFSCKDWHTPGIKSTLIQSYHNNVRWTICKATSTRHPVWKWKWHVLSTQKQSEMNELPFSWTRKWILYSWTNSSSLEWTTTRI